jgi:hypothetical protein
MQAWVEKLPSRPEEVIDGVGQPFEQCADYVCRVSPIQPAAKLFLPFIEEKKLEAGVRGSGVGSNAKAKARAPLSTPPPTTPLYTPFLWKQVIRHFNVPFQYEHCFITQLKNFIMDPVMMSFLGGRRAYPVLNMLDQPKLSVEKKHLDGFGYFVSFLTDSEVDVEGSVYKWAETANPNTLYFSLGKK